ncbi:MAG: sigma 54-interacting transcriptional regulator [Nitrospiraceae bacterium]|nr:sigma 54-interacting transcriptional regulator [Nitrospiraceae bacterium]
MGTSGKGVFSFLLITSDETLHEFLRGRFGPSGLTFECRQALPANLRRSSFGSRPVLIDLRMPEALKILSDLKAYHPDSKVAAFANGDFKKSEDALRMGANYIVFEREKPELLKDILFKTCQEAAIREELEYLRSLSEPRIIAKSPAMKKLLKDAEEAAASPLPVFLSGPAGSGRELVARHIHGGSGRAIMPFVSAGPEQEPLFAEAVLSARGGTLYIKETSAFSKEALEKLRALIQTGAFRQDESAPAISADVRLMAGHTGQDGTYPLFEGLPHMKLDVPPLRERKEDIVPLAECFIEEIGRFLGTGKKHLTKCAKTTLGELDYPGGAAELKNIIHRVYFLVKGRNINDKDLLGSEYLSRCSFKSFIEERLRGYFRRMAELGHSSLYDSVIGEVEKALIELALRETGGNKVRSAKALGMNRNTFRAKIKQLKIKETKTPPKDGNP